ncbi:MAG: two-component regulator propeller domain-containing protein [Candidatus Rifleibacteriota bacterium]
MKKTIKLIITLFLLTASIAYTKVLTIEKINHPILEKKRICAVASKGRQTVWATHNQIIYKHGKKKFQVFDPTNSPLVEAADISDVAICNKEIWVTQINATNGYGIFHYDGKEWHSYQKPTTEGILNNRIIKIHVDSDDVIWFGHENQGISRMVENVPMHFANQKIVHLFDNRLLNLYMQVTHLWIGTSNGIARYRSEIESNYYLNIDIWKYPEFPARAAYSITGYGYDDIVAGTDTGLAIYNGKDWRMLKKKAGIKALPARCLLTDNNSIWIGSPIGLQKWNPNKASELITSRDGLPGNRINDFCLDNENNLLVATNKGAAIIKQN